MMKVGEEVIYFSGGFTSEDRDGYITTVTHVTPTGRFKIEVAGDAVFDGETLKKRGSRGSGAFRLSPYCVKITKDTEVIKQRALKRVLINRLRSVDFTKLPYRVMIELDAVVSRYEGEKGKK